MNVRKGEQMGVGVDQQIFEEYYKGIYKELYRFAICTLGKAEDAEDVVSETVMDAWKYRNQLRKQEAFRAWIFRILSVKCNQKIKDYIEQRSLFCKELPEDLVDQRAGTEKIAEYQDIRRACLVLESQDRLILSMSVFGGYNSREIGKQLQMKDTTVRSRLYRALDKLEQVLQA